MKKHPRSRREESTLMGRAAVRGEGSVAMAGNSSSASGCAGGDGEGVRLRCCQGLHPLPAHPHSGRTWTDARWKRAEEGSKGCTRRVAMVKSYSRRGWSGRAGDRGGWRPSLDRENWVKEKAAKKKKYERREENFAAELNRVVLTFLIIYFHFGPHTLILNIYV